MYEPPSPLPPGETLPTMYDLPSEDPGEPGLPDEFHEFQPQLLRETCKPTTYLSDQVFVGTDLNLYYDSRHTSWYKRPDWFLVLGVERAKQQDDLRWSYVVWQEGVDPFLVVELLSPGTEADDLGQMLRDVDKPPTKWQVYEQVLRVPYYAVFDRYENLFQLFQLVGTRYQALAIPDQSYWFEELALELAVWRGEYEGVQGQWLRWRDGRGHWVPTAQEQVAQERQRAEQAQQQTGQERQRAERLAERLRSLGVDPEAV